mmetsp:Transcript_12795/g.18898  ORF Transcript_12795/g.18898 Transcript_12795/m.18898 type:complete len:177 (+) Transcript_12795:699-1229(+)
MAVATATRGNFNTRPASSMKRHVRRRLSRSCAVVRPCLSDGSCDSSKACGTRRGGPGGGGGWEDGLGGGGAALGGGGRDDLGGGGCDRGGGGRDGGFGRDGGGPLGGGGGCDMTEVYANEGCVCVCVRVVYWCLRVRLYVVIAPFEFVDWQRYVHTHAFVFHKSRHVRFKYRERQV